MGCEYLFMLTLTIEFKFLDCLLYTFVLCVSVVLFVLVGILIKEWRSLTSALEPDYHASTFL